MNTSIVPCVNALTVTYSNVNQAYFVVWHLQVLSIHNDKADAIAEYNRILNSRNSSFVHFN